MSEQNETLPCGHTEGEAQTSIRHEICNAPRSTDGYRVGGPVAPVGFTPEPGEEFIPLDRHHN